MQRKTGLHPKPPVTRTTDLQSKSETIKSHNDSGEMFTSEMKEQLEGVFSKMERKLILKLYLDNRPVSLELEGFITKLADLTDKLTVMVNKFPALSFVKQVVTMFCSLLPLSEVKKLGFDKFLLQKESNNIDKSLFDLRMYLTPFNVGQLMVGPTSIVNKTENGFETIIACDLGTYPFGFILNLTPEIKVEYGTSLMNLFDAVYDKEYSMNWPLMYLERTNDIIPIPLLFKPLPKSINDKTTKKN